MGRPTPGGSRTSGFIWIREDIEGMPSLAVFRRTAEGEGWYVLVDPDSSCRILNDGGVSAGKIGGRLAGMVFCAFALPGGLSAAIAGSWSPAVALFLFGGLGGMVLGGLLIGVLNAVTDRAHKSGNEKAGCPRSFEVVRTDRRAWRLCETAAMIGRSEAWRGGTVDLHRQVPSILWSAVGRSLEVEQRREDAMKALGHDALRDLAQESLERADRERLSLDAVESNLATILATATAIDGRRDRLARESKIAHDRKIEERELRSRLAGSSERSAEANESDRQADRSAGLVAEVDAVSGLLDESDRMLREIRRDS